MAKKKNTPINIPIIDQELRPTVIGEVDDTEKKPTFLIFIFILLIVMLFGLPYITDFYTNLKSGTVVSGNNGSNSSTKNKETEQQPSNNDEPYYMLASDKPITYDLVELSDFQFNQLNNKYYIRFNLRNATTKAINISEQNYYLELYNSEKTLLERIKILGGTLEINATSSQIYEIKNNLAVQLKFLHKSIEDYPAFELNGANSSLTCKKDNETYIYKFKNNKLNNITEIYSYTATGGVIANVNAYKNKVSSYNALPGVVAQVNENGNSFEFKADLDLTKTKIASLTNEHLYENATVAKIVHFEMNAMGYTCN